MGMQGPILGVCGGSTGVCRAYAWVCMGATGSILGVYRGVQMPWNVPVFDENRGP